MQMTNNAPPLQYDGGFGVEVSCCRYSGAGVLRRTSRQMQYADGVQI